MRLLVIRHGESEADILDVHEGRADFELTERGHRQAEAMSKYVKEHYQIDKIYCSTLKRAAQTAKHLADETNAPMFLEENLMEFNNGLLTGLERQVVNEKYPQVSVPIHSSVYEQESALMFRYRADFMLSKILSENDSDSTIAVITHGGMINQLYRAFFKLSVDAEIFFYTGDTGIHEWLSDGNVRSVVRANCLVHNI
ncbi:MAG: histidine phosphatase family protein [Oscillospiraceae bacterium]|nr:histidine phosphatase family protein [Oscillospiraceae bacterium]